MKKSILFAASVVVIAGLTGCFGESTPPTPTPDLTQIKATNKVGEEVLVMTDGTRKVVQGKTANIKGEAKFDSIEGSTLTFTDGISEISDVVRDSTITIQKGGVLKVPYIKNSTITVEKGGDLQVKERIKESKIILKDGDFSVRPADMDEKTTVVQE